MNENFSVAVSGGRV